MTYMTYNIYIYIYTHTHTLGVFVKSSKPPTGEFILLFIFAPLMEKFCGYPPAPSPPLIFFSLFQKIFII
jgi:hypothetical protein